MALQFEERVIDEWTDGILVIQRIQVYCDGEAEEVKRRVFRYETSVTPTVPQEGKTMRWITGWNDGPLGGDRHWSLEEIDAVIQQWLDSMSPVTSDQMDHHIVSTLRILLRGAIPDGVSLGNNHVRYEILSKVHLYADQYMTRHNPMDNDLSAHSTDTQ